MSDPADQHPAGGFVTAISDTFKGSPACLAAVLLSGMIVFLFYTSRTAEREAQQAMMMKLLDSCTVKGSTP